MMTRYCSASARSGIVLPGWFNQVVRLLASASVGAI